MANEATFRVDYPNGHIQVNIGSYFGTMESRKIKTLLRLASQFCSNEQREELLIALNRADRKRKEALDSVEVLEKQKIEILSPFLDHTLMPTVSGPEKELKKQRTKITQSIKILEEVWPL